MFCYSSILSDHTADLMLHRVTRSSVRWLLVPVLRHCVIIRPLSPCDYFLPSSNDTVPLQWLNVPCYVLKKKPFMSRCTVQHVYLSSSRIKKKIQCLLGFFHNVERDRYRVKNAKKHVLRVKQKGQMRSIVSRKRGTIKGFVLLPTNILQKNCRDARTHTRIQSADFFFAKSKGKKKNGIDPVSPISLMGIDYKVSQSQANVKKK